MTSAEAETRLRDAIRRRHLAYSTEKSYLTWLRRYEAWLRDTAPVGDCTSKVTAFLTALAHQDLSAVSQNQALQALLMFYREVMGQEIGRVDALRARRPQHIRYAPSKDEVRALLGAVENSNGYPIRLIVHLLYACGLRVGEPLNLRIKDCDLANSRLIVRQAKGGKDRAVSVPCVLVEALTKQLAVARALWAQDHSAGVPVPLPHQLAKKYPSYAHAAAWYWVFPARNTCRHPRTGEIVRYRVLESNVQRAVRDAARKTGLTGQVTPHCLRHAYATHAMQAGAYVRDVQVAMGHNHLETTMGYLHTEADRVPSPLLTLEVSM